jgi:hypothetical protein
MVVPAPHAGPSLKGSTQSRLDPRHPGILSLRIGQAAVEQLFSPGATSVEFELDHLRIVCALDPGFWLGHGEISDHRLSSWLQSKRSSGKLAAHDGSIAIVPCGKLAFRLMPVPPPVPGGPMSAIDTDRSPRLVPKPD